MRAALYCRTSTTDQNPENQARELRSYAAARGWAVTEFVDQISGVKESRPALDRLQLAARRRQFDVILVWDLSRLGRSLGHLIRLVEDWQALGISLVSFRDGLDLATPSGRLQMHVLGALATFERERLRERVICGLQRAKAQGKQLGRRPYAITDDQFEAVAHLSVREAAKALAVSYSVVHRWRLSQRSIVAA
jgi:DNA invertase Pin-like site-specific DNA recombinase